MKREALLVIGMVNDFVLPDAPLEVPETREVLPNIRREIGSGPGGVMPILYLCDDHAPDDKEFRKFGWPAHAVRGTKGAEVVDELKPAPNDTEGIIMLPCFERLRNSRILAPCYVSLNPISSGH